MNLSERIPFGQKAEDFHWITSFEDAFVPQHRHINERPLDEYELTQHYLFWKEDIKKAKDLGVQMLRYGFPWYRVNTAPKKFDWQWVDEVVDHMINKCKIQLMMDLNHYNCPLWIDNEFINHSYPQRQAEYAYAFAERYSKLVHVYNPHNEPVVNAYFSGAQGEWPPYLHGQDGFVKVLFGLAKAVVLTIKAIREADPRSRFVHVEGAAIATTKDKNLEEIARMREEQSSLFYDLISGRLKEDHILYSFLVDNGATEKDFQWFQDNHIELDILGINYYPQASHPVLGEGPILEQERLLGGKEYLEKWFLKYHEKYGRPMILTETCFFGTSEEKAQWLEDSCAVIKRVRSQGIPVIGYNWWFLIDSVGWDYKWGRGNPEEYIGFFPSSVKDTPRKGGGLYKLVPGFDGTLKRVKQTIVDIYKSYIQNAKTKVGDLNL